MAGMDIEIIREKTTPDRVREHATLTPERWASFSLATQMMNISSEIARAESFEKKQDFPHRDRALDRAHELIQLSVAGASTRPRRRELSRLKEMFLGASFDPTHSPMTLADIQAELEPFALICAKERGV